MPIGEIEEHPYLDYFINLPGNENQVDWLKYENLLIGSFPIYKITKTVFPIIANRHLNPNIYMPFFYGSKSNLFWKRISETLGQANPLNAVNAGLRKLNAITLLESNKILLTDIIKKTNRCSTINGKEDLYSPFDNALFNKRANNALTQQFCLNESIIEWLARGENIYNIYFTAQKQTTGKNPGVWFHKLLRNNGIKFESFFENENSSKYRMIIANKTRVFKLFYLPTTSSSRSIAFTEQNRHPMFVNYLLSHYLNFYNKLELNNFKCNNQQKIQLEVHRENFIQLWWDQFLVQKSTGFNGTRYN